MGKQVFRIFMRGFLQTLFVIACMILCATVGFFATRFYYNQKNKISEKADAAATLDEVSKNLIFVWDDSKNKITGCVLEVFDSKNYDMTYFNISCNSQLTLSADLFQRLYQINPEIPQVLKLSNLCKYFEDEENAYAYGQLILEEYFDIDISYYTTVNKADFEQAFEQKNVSNGINANKGKGYVLKDSFIKELSKLKGEDELKGYLEDLYDNTISNLDTSDRLSYAKSYIKVNPETIQYLTLPCKKEGKNYVFRLDKAKKILNKHGLMGTENDRESDDSFDEPEETPVPVKQLNNIVILNSTTTTGVAASWQEKLRKEGYNVLSIGNYTERTLTSTQIVVSESGKGEEFLQYFDGAEIVVGDVPAGADAQIIVGTNDAQ